MTVHLGGPAHPPAKKSPPCLRFTNFKYQVVSVGHCANITPQCPAEISFIQNPDSGDTAETSKKDRTLRAGPLRQACHPPCEEVSAVSPLHQFQISGCLCGTLR